MKNQPLPFLGGPFNKKKFIEPHQMAAEIEMELPYQSNENEEASDSLMLDGVLPLEKYPELISTLRTNCVDFEKFRKKVKKVKGLSGSDLQRAEELFKQLDEYYLDVEVGIDILRTIFKRLSEVFAPSRKPDTTAILRGIEGVSERSGCLNKILKRSSELLACVNGLKDCIDITSKKKNRLRVGLVGIAAGLVAIMNYLMLGPIAAVGACGLGVVGVLTLAGRTEKKRREAAEAKRSFEAISQEIATIFGGMGKINGEQKALDSIRKELVGVSNCKLKKNLRSLHDICKEIYKQADKIKDILAIKNNPHSRKENEKK